MEQQKEKEKEMKNFLTSKATVVVCRVLFCLALLWYDNYIENYECKKKKDQKQSTLSNFVLFKKRHKQTSWGVEQVMTLRVYKHRD
jgi:uncharacterized membrane protein YesL